MAEKASENRRRRDDAASGPGAAAGSRLDTLERWWMEVITHPDGVDVGSATPSARAIFDRSVEAVVEPSQSLSSEERLGIYSSMYFSRLFEVLEKDFAATRDVVGVDDFRRLSAEYVIRHPPYHYSLNRLGESFAKFLRDEADDCPHRAFAAEVASLERVIEEIFDAPEAPGLDVDALLAISPEDWGDARFRLIPASRLCAFEHPVNAFFEARRRGKLLDVPRPEASWLAVFRRDFRTWRLPLAEDRYRLLAAIAEGKVLGEAIEDCLESTGLTEDELLPQLERWFRDWAGEGLFAGVEVAGAGRQG